MTDKEKAEKYIRENVCNKERVFGSQSVCSDKAIRECNEHGNFCYFAKINRKSFLDGLAKGRKEQEKKDKGFCESFCMKGGKNAVLEKENSELKAQIENMQIMEYQNLYKQRENLHKDLINEFTEQLGIMDKEEDVLFSLEEIKSTIDFIMELE